MNFFDILLIISIGLISYFFILMKSTLRGKGHNVEYFYGWSSDFYKFKDMIEKETSKREKAKFKFILYGLYSSVALLALVALIGGIVK